MVTEAKGPLACVDALLHHQVGALPKAFATGDAGVHSCAPRWLHQWRSSIEVLLKRHPQSLHA